VNVPQAHEYMRAIQPCNTDLYCIVVTSWHCVLHSKLAIKWCTALFGVKSIGYYNKKFTTSLRSLFLSFLYFFICPPQPTCSHSHITPYTMYGMALATHEWTKILISVSNQCSNTVIWCSALISWASRTVIAMFIVVSVHRLQNSYKIVVNHVQICDFQIV